MKKALLFFSILFTYLNITAQNTGSLSGFIIDKNSLNTIYGASILLNTNNGTTSDSLGYFSFKGIISKSYTLQISKIGYITQTLYNVSVTSANENNLNIELEPAVKTLTEVSVKSTQKTAKAATLETPLSVQRLTTEEIKSNPGGNFDISRVIQALPGVGGTAGSSGGFRNDIIIRGGAPNENVFFLDGIEIPVINHFQTQGSSGGPTGILNVSFIEEVKLSSSSFDARYDNALSSVFQFKQKTGNRNKLQGNIRLSGTELAATFDGPLSKNKKTTFLASARRSYLQLLFKAIDLPIRPNYWDFQYKINHQINSKTTLAFIGVGAIDEFSFGVPKTATPEKLYVLGNSPSIQQWNYTIGATLRHQTKNGYFTVALSRNAFDNDLEKYDDNDNSNSSKKRLKAVSRETENKLRFDINNTIQGWKLGYGAIVQQVNFSSNYYNRFRAEIRDNNNTVIQPAIIVQSNTAINFLRYGLYAQAGKRFFEDRLGINAGLRTDMNSFTTTGNNPLKTLSPRVSLSYVVTNKFTINATIGHYFKIPVYTLLGFKDNNGTLVNESAKYIQNSHYVAGFEYLPSPSTRFTLEGFYKKYAHYPVSIRTGISLANLGGDFTAVGNEAIQSTGKGQAYGFEFFAQQKLTKKFFGIVSYTYSYSKFTGINGKYVPSAWDNRHLLSLTAGYKLKRNWEIGMKFRYQGGAPLTPFDEIASRANYLSLGEGVLNYNLLNSNRLGSFHASDVRIDKKWYLKKITLDLFLDVTNWYGASNPSNPSYTFKRTTDNSAFQTTDGLPIQSNGSNAIPILLLNNDPQITPTIGFIVEF
ncbi:MAG: TonB-dependent receptor [Ferruginibacter sp.]